MSIKSLKIGTRKSPLALRQTQIVSDILKQHYPSIEIIIIPITTTGDATQKSNRNLATIGGKALFLKELEVALQNKEIDIAIHSLKDVPAWVGPDFSFPCALEREDPRDAFISVRHTSLKDIPKDAILGTCSTRRQAQILANRNDLTVTSFRGNVGTRLEKLKQGEADFTFLAFAGLKRLDLHHHATQVLETSEMVPAIGQGAITIETLCENKNIVDLLKPLNHSATSECVNAERALLATLGGSCTTPIGAYCTQNNGALSMQAFLGTPDGKNVYRISENSKEGERPLAFGLRCGLVLHKMVPAFILGEIGLFQTPAKTIDDLKLNTCGF